MQKDYWNIAKRNFRAMGIIAVLVSIIFGLGIMDSTNPDSVRTWLLGVLAFLVLTFILFFVIASLFKKHSPKAIVVAYSYLTVATIFSVVGNFILSSPSNGLIFKLLNLLILAYLFENVYKASKQSSVSVA